MSLGRSRYVDDVSLLICLFVGDSGLMLIGRTCPQIVVCPMLVVPRGVTLAPASTLSAPVVRRLILAHSSTVSATCTTSPAAAAADVKNRCSLTRPLSHRARPTPPCSSSMTRRSHRVIDLPSSSCTVHRPPRPRPTAVARLQQLGRVGRRHLRRATTTPRSRRRATTTFISATVT